MARAQRMSQMRHEVHYRAKSVERSLAFYVHLGFKAELLDAPASARASMDGLTLFLTGLDEADLRKLLANRKRRDRKGISIEVDDLVGHVASLKEIGFRFRNEIEEVPGGKRMRLEDPDGNPVELVERSRAHFPEPARAEVPGGRAAAMMSAAHGLLSPRHALPRR